MLVWEWELESGKASFSENAPEILGTEVTRIFDVWKSIPEQDLARIPVKTESVPVPVEQFTIAVTAKDDNARDALLTLMWDRTRVVVPFRVE